MIVLDNDMFVLYENFKAKDDAVEEIDYLTLVKLISAMKLEPKTDFKQLEECKARLPDKFYKDMQPRLSPSYKKRGEIAELALDTKHKLVLTNDSTKVTIPYLNISKNNVEANYTIYCEAGKNRNCLVKHISNLCSGAKKIYVCDQYIHAASKSGFLNLQALFPLRKIDVTIRDGRGSKREAGDAEKQLTKHERCYSEWKVLFDKSLNFKKVHDRYIRIDDKYEIILSSGFEYLFNTKKEITCVFRER